MRGSVKWFNNRRGFGFITGEDGNEYFVHHTGIIAEEGVFRKLKDGQAVEFSLEESEKGPRAVNVRVLG